MTKAHPHRQVNVHLDTVDDADIIERIEAQPSMVGYVRELVRRDIHDERLGYVALKASELQAENAKLRELVSDMQPFWHRMADEEPSDEKGKYLLVGKLGAMYLASGFHVWEHSGRRSFYIPNNRSGYVDFDKVKAWAVVPEMGVDE